MCRGLHPTPCICVCVCVCVSTEHVTVSPAVCQRTVLHREGFIGFMQCIIRREGRGLCFDRVTAAWGAEFVVVSTRRRSVAAPADGDRPPPHPLHLLITVRSQS